jgi:hypothetical protein
VKDITEGSTVKGFPKILQKFVRPWPQVQSHWSVGGARRRKAGSTPVGLRDTKDYPEYLGSEDEERCVR